MTTQSHNSEPVPYDVKFIHNVSEAEEIRLERVQLQKNIDSLYTDIEQSAMWQCMNDKTCPYLHANMDRIIRSLMTSSTPGTLYRGLSRTTRDKIRDLQVGDTFIEDRVTSFTSNHEVAKSFLSTYRNCMVEDILLVVRNPQFAFNYREKMLEMLHAAPDSEFFHHGLSPEHLRADKIEMVDWEEEWMLPKGTTFRLVDVSSEVYYNEYITLVFEVEIVSF